MAVEYEEIRQKTADAGRVLLESGLIVRTWGNISARVSEDTFVITPSGRGYEDLQAEDIIPVSIRDLSYSGDTKPSSEKALHAYIYQHRPEVKFIIHTHQKYASALSVLGKIYPVGRILPEAVPVLGNYIPTAHYGLSSTKWLGRNVDRAAQAFSDSQAILMQGHGAVCFGTDADSAFTVAKTLEEVVKKRYGSLAKDVLPPEFDQQYSKRDFYRIYHREINDEYDEHYLVFSGNEEIGAVIDTQTPFLRRLSEYGHGMKVCIDDLAQMTGTSIACLPEDASEKQIASALKETRSAVLIRGKGAVCAGPDEDEAEAVCMVMEKNAMAALLGETGAHIHGIQPALGALEHFVYKTKYSKLK